jgi:hypothetical protein
LTFAKTSSINALGLLIDLVKFGFQEILEKKPFLVQCFSVSSLFLHFINFNKRQNFKERVAQIASWEGNSIIAALMKNFVDAITSTWYLASRDHKVFEHNFNAFGATSSLIAHDYPKSSGFNDVILYETKLRFWVCILREGIFVVDWLLFH